MQTFEDIQALQAAISSAKRAGKTVAFVPTMGNLHTGHISLVERAKQEADYIVVSIFVNPMQFGANEDLDKYPRTLEADQEKLANAGVDALFFPTVELIYPEGLDAHSKVSVPNITQRHCGASRPGHFDGVTTIVNKLFNIVQADLAVFGEKDFQQLAVIRKMAKDLLIPTQIIGAATARDHDGLALSSRNQYLSDDARSLAGELYKTLKSSQTKLEAGESADTTAETAIKALSEKGFKVDYFNIADAYTLEPVNAQSREIVILAAAFLGTTRLIDNLSFSLNPVYS